jgi:hypothetical protein
MTKSESTRLFNKLMDDAARDYEAMRRSDPHLDLVVLVHVQDCGDHQHVWAGMLDRGDAVRFFRSRGEHATAGQIEIHPGLRTLAIMDEVAGMSDVVFKPPDRTSVSRN